ncbi:TetR/AcrR family transcriptional regulator [Xylanimonas oleitrophica]|uniref:TetR/AcrR family transcriptional regulator n=1 Tax=Xylanimonas oleitrophica TaxID=2607479 RepID=A0A2W5YD83_9MICO|nr:TetR/AcrR family transcriptional regulator [Xylanimonas oleitrophica]PZR52241.1 TetR/AcrR family transcriptional regulator [Xylanimonas oleitrophica]
MSRRHAVSAPLDASPDAGPEASSRALEDPSAGALTARATPEEPGDGGPVAASDPASDVVSALERVNALLHEDDETAQRVLELAEARVAAHGTAGLNIAELARAAGVSRPTLYRRWEDADAILQTILLRRLIGCVDAVGGPVAESRAELTSKLVAYADAFFADPVLSRLGETEPEVFSRFLLERFSPIQLLLVGWIAAAVAGAQADGSVRAADPHRTAVMLLLVMQSTILSYRTVAPLIDPEHWSTELRFLVDGYLRP